MNTTSNTAQNTSGVFVSTLSALHNGRVMGDCDEALREVTKAVQASGIKGKLTVELVIMPNGIGVGGTPLFSVEENIKTTIPKTKRKAQTFFVDDDSNLTRRGPGQTEIGFTLVEDGKITPPSQTKASGQ